MLTCQAYPPARRALPVWAGNGDLVDVIKDGDLAAMLLDMCELALHQVFAPGVAQDSMPDLAGCDQLWAALTALVAVLAIHQEAPPMSQDLCCDLMLLFTDTVQVKSSCMCLLERNPACVYTCGGSQMLLVSMSLLLMLSSYVSEPSVHPMDFVLFC